MSPILKTPVHTWSRGAFIRTEVDQFLGLLDSGSREILAAPWLQHPRIEAIPMVMQHLLHEVEDLAKNHADRDKITQLYGEAIAVVGAEQMLPFSSWVGTETDLMINVVTDKRLVPAVPAVLLARSRRLDQSDGPEREAVFVYRWQVLGAHLIALRRMASTLVSTNDAGGQGDLLVQIEALAAVTMGEMGEIQRARVAGLLATMCDAGPRDWRRVVRAVDTTLAEDRFLQASIAAALNGTGVGSLDSFVNESRSARLDALRQEVLAHLDARAPLAVCDLCNELDASRPTIELVLERAILDSVVFRQLSPGSDAVFSLMPVGRSEVERSRPTGRS